MSRARQVRIIVLQILYAWDTSGEAEESTALQIAHDSTDDATIRLRAMDLANKAWEYHPQADAWVQRIAPQWPPYRQPVVDRNLIRMALWEIISGQTPPKVAIDEAIELAKIYSSEQSPAFVNGVLDAALKEIQTLQSPPQSG